ncbi:hypothetical protein PHMEG_00036031 [Phytophthora megakarya]|uniref:C2H2-type domain-containing protein n=1 Tax=Phytophthora megakarya TaxID=4795 RepID=A0A225UMY2_9STRA|nr:hypothetical protein PHMEG_00036031 [Phytophthora megakarya]
MNVCAMPGLIMIATEPDTFLYTFGWTSNVALKSNRHLITLNKGDIVMFRGDLIYQPVGYRTNNLSLYAYLDPLEYTRPEIHHPHVFTVIDDIRSNDDPFCFVWNCGFKGENMSSVRKHLNRFHHFHFNEKRRKHDPEESLVIE